jgi:hypothetical protein
MIFFHELKYIEILDNIKKNISKMKRGVSMDVKKGLSIDNINFKYLSSQRMSKNDEEHTYNDDISNRGTFEISLNHSEDNFFMLLFLLHHQLFMFLKTLLNGLKKERSKNINIFYKFLCVFYKNVSNRDFLFIKTRNINKYKNHYYLYFL